MPKFIEKLDNVYRHTIQQTPILNFLNEASIKYQILLISEKMPYTLNNKLFVIVI